MSTAFTPLVRASRWSVRGVLASSRSSRLTVGVVAAAIALGACGRSDDDSSTDPVTIDKVTVDPTEAIIVAGKTATLSAKALAASGQTVSGSGMQWSTDNASVATVAATGTVTAVATGATRINASANSRTGFSIVSVVPGPTQQTVPAGGATVSTPGGEVKVLIPGGSLPSGGSVTIEALTSGTAPGTTVPGTVYKVGVFGITVGPRPTITVRYSVAGLPPNFDETKLTLSRKVGVFWIPLPSQVNTVEKTITATLPASYIASASTEALAQVSLADEEIIVGGALFILEADVSTLQMTVGDRRRVTAHVRSLATNTLATLTSANVSSSAAGVAGPSGAATVSGTDMSAEIVATAQGTASLTVSAAITSGGATESFAAVVPVTVAPQAALAVNIGGLPAGVNGDVTVTGPSSFSQKISASRTFLNVTPGSYTVAAAAVSSGGQTYQASQATQTITVAAGQGQTATVTYGPTLGALAIAVTGLAGGSDAAITVTGPGGFSRAVTSTATLQSLTPGSYTIGASNVTVAGQPFAPAPQTQSVTVSAGQTANASVAYAVGVGALTITMNGLPSGIASSVKVTGPEAFSRAVTATSTLTGLAPGAYTIDAADVDAPQQLYTGTASPGSVTVVAGQTATATVAYAATLGQMAVTVTGCSTVDVRVTGPNGFSKQLTTSGTLSRLAAGAYTVASNPVSSGPPENSQVCRPLAASQQVNVSAAATAAVSSTYVPGFTIQAQGSGAGSVSLSAPNCSPASLCGVGGFYPNGTTINILATATSLARVASVGGVNPGACSFSPPASDLSLTFKCSVTATTTRTINATFALLPPTTIEKASADSTMWKQNAQTFICCSTVRVRNARGTPVPNVAVTWKVPGNATPFENSTDASGVSGKVGITFPANPSPGSYSLVATIPIGANETRSVAFTYIVVAGSEAGSTAPPTTGSTAGRPSPAPPTR